MRGRIDDATRDVPAAALRLNREPGEFVAVALPLPDRPLVARAPRTRRMLAYRPDRIIADPFAAGDGPQMSPDRQRIEAPADPSLATTCAT